MAAAARTPRDLVSHLYQQWRDRLGEDHEHTLMAAHYLAWALLELGHYAESRDLNEDTLERRRRVMGDDHPDTLNSAHNLAVNLRELGDVQAARDLDHDNPARQRRVLGEDHPSASRSASSLAADLRELGEVQAARDLDEDTLGRRRQVLGQDHPTPFAPPTTWPPTCAHMTVQLTGRHDRPAGRSGTRIGWPGRSRCRPRTRWADVPAWHAEAHGLGFACNE